MNNLASPQRILLVEDEVMVSWALEDVLTGLGYSVVGPAARVDEALNFIKNEPLDAVLLDINLNGETSYPVADALIARGVPFIFSTGYNKTRLPDNYLKYATLQKPFERSALQKALADVLVPVDRTQPALNDDTAIWDTHRLRRATDAAGVALWSWNVDTNQIALDERARELWGVPKGVVTFEDLSSHIHPEDLDRVRAAFTATRGILGGYDIEFRILHDTDIRYISARGRGDDQGIVGRLMFGVFLDVTERKVAEEAREMIADEMGHRVKNLFAIASALTEISARSTKTTSDMAADLTLRFNALSRAHDLVRPVLSEPKKGAFLSDLLAVLLAPYTGAEPLSARVKVSVPILLVGEKSATTLALVAHELATNSMKYGALSVEAGTLELSCEDTGNGVVIVWKEQGGPAVVAPVGKAGFGSHLIARSITGQFGGTVDFDWHTSGVVVTLSMKKDHLKG